MRRVQQFFATMGIPVDRPEVVLAQYKAFSRQVPLMYFIVVICTIAVAVTYARFAPFWLTGYYPAFLCAVSVVRLTYWRRARHRSVTVDEAVRILKGLMRTIILLGMSYSVWGTLLFQYGDLESHLLVIYFITITTFGCIVCMMHLRAAVFVMVLATVVPLATALLTTDDFKSVVIGVNGLLVVSALVIIVSKYYHDFADLIESRRTLQDQQVKTQVLSETNKSLANMDALTGLPNRRWFFDTLSEKFEAAQSSGATIAVGVIDLDGFKPVNDLYGHTAGDKVLIEVAARLRLHVSPTLHIARLGGDEFGLILEGAKSGGDVLLLGNAICDTLRRPYSALGFVAQVSGSLGFSDISVAVAAAEQLFEQADYALNYAKRSLRGQVMLFSDEHETEIRDLSIIDQNLRSANLKEELWLVFQPIFNTRSQTTLAFEVLARWKSAVLGDVPPMTFIRAAERAGLVNDITLILLSKLLATVSCWPEDIRFSFNLSVHDVTSPRTIERILELVAASGINPGRLDFEITETALMHDFDQARTALHRLRSLGCRISLDDFGTGHSSLGYVHQLPLDKIKVDRSFVHNIETEKTCQALTRTIIDLCRNLDLVCVVEGIETAGQQQLVQEAGCSLMQGFLFSRPMSLEDTLDFLDTERRTKLATLVSAQRPEADLIGHTEQVANG
jgi:diguanylate cyclase (GGDEF)-like protein